MSLSNKIVALSRLNLFAGFEREALRLLVFAAPQIDYSAGDELFCRGDRLDGAYFLVSGIVVLKAECATFVKEKIVHSGALIAARALLSEVLAGTTATAYENSVTMKISRELLRRVLTEYPRSADAMRKAALLEIEKFHDDVGETRRLSIVRP